MLEGEIRISGLHSPITLIRDRWGMAHIFATDMHDAYFGQGFVTAADRLWQVELAFRTLFGTLSEWFGEKTLPSDRWHRVTGCHLAGDPITRNLDDLSREISRAWAAGVKAWIEAMPARPLEYEILDIEPDMPDPDRAEILLAVHGLAGLLPSNIDMELMRLAVVERAGWEVMRELLPGNPADPFIAVAGKRHGGTRSTALELLRSLPLPPPDGRGSNNWVISGSRTVSGKPILANDPHQGYSVPSQAYETHLCAPGMDFGGANWPFSPAVGFGWSDRTAWGITAAVGDCQDLYLERLNDDGTAALYIGQWEPIQQRLETIGIRGRDPELLTVRSTRHGPLIDSSVWSGGMSPSGLMGLMEDDRNFALRWTFAEQCFNVSTLHRMGVATNFAEFREALRSWRGQEVNVVFADIDGNIGYQMAGEWPIRRTGDGEMPVPGWTDEYEWVGMIPFDELPYSYNPECGFLATANNRTYDSSYPYFIGKDFRPSYRVRRITELITATEKHTTATVSAIHADTYSLEARNIAPYLARLTPDDRRCQDAIALVRDWDYDLGRESVPAAIYQVWLKHLAARMLTPRLGADLATMYYERCRATEFPAILANSSASYFGRDGTEARDRLVLDALIDALDELTNLLGAEMSRWTWGALHKLLMVHEVAALTEETDADVIEFLTLGEVQFGGDGNTVNNAGYLPALGYATTSGATWRQVIDLANIEGSPVVQFAGASANPVSPHWDDMLELRFSDRYHPLVFGRDHVEAAAESRCELLSDT